MSVSDNVRDIANDISRVCAGRNTAEVYIAIAVIIGDVASRADRPDLDGLLRLIDKMARDVFGQHVAKRKPAN
jgi:predicted RNA-binding protein with EMAP domain